MPYYRPYQAGDPPGSSIFQTPGILSSALTTLPIIILVIEQQLLSFDAKCGIVPYAGLEVNTGD